MKKSDDFFAPSTGGYNVPNVVSNAVSAVAQPLDQLVNGRQYSRDQRNALIAKAAIGAGLDIAKTALDVYTELDKEKTKRAAMHEQTECYKAQIQKEIEEGKNASAERISKMEAWRQGTTDLIKATRDDPRKRDELISKMMNRLDKLSEEF